MALAVAEALNPNKPNLYMCVMLLLAEIVTTVNICHVHDVWEQPKGWHQYQRLPRNDDTRTRGYL